MKLNVMVRLEIEFVYYDVAVQYISHYTTGTFPPNIDISSFDQNLLILFSWRIIVTPCHMYIYGLL